MAVQDYKERAEELGLRRIDLDPMRFIARWFNGEVFKIAGEKKSIATDYEPSLRQLMGMWDDEYQRRFEAFHEAGWLESRYIAGRECHWAPNEPFLQAIEDVFYDYEGIYPNWVVDHRGAPLFRDGTEKLEHRKAVFAAAVSLERLTRVSGVEWYPPAAAESRPDLRVYDRQGQHLARVEALSSHNNINEMFTEKLAGWHQYDLPTIWVFPRREDIPGALNYLQRESNIELDGGFFGGDHSNWSTKKVNKRLQRTRNGPGVYSSIDVCLSLPSLIEAGELRMHNWLTKFDVINLSE